MFLCVVFACPDFWDVPNLCSKGTHRANLLSCHLLPVLTCWCIQRTALFLTLEEQGASCAFFSRYLLGSKVHM